MKEIRAYIQPFMLSKVTQALLEIPGFPGMSVSDCEGFDGDSHGRRFHAVHTKKAH
ncbi:nitrogen regulatory protein P-II 1 [Nitrosospira sp. Nsp1]|nr:nitrogen regulatory protein P-II 1 [Nitrosospira sp. Nsp1]